MVEDSSLVVVGGGKMGEALLGGLLRSGRPPSTLSVVEKDEGRRAEMTARYPQVRVVNHLGESTPSAALIAVKPGDVEAVCRALAATGAVRRVLSIAAGVRLAALESWLAGTADVAVVRAMTNIAALVGAAASAVAAGRYARELDVAWARAILESVGGVVTVAEHDLDAVTGLSGSGPAYVFLLAEALIDAGIDAGLSRDTARDLAVQTVLGSGRMLAETGEEAAALRQSVTSPRGTTEAGLGALRDAGFREAVAAAVDAGTRRSRELAGPG